MNAVAESIADFNHRGLKAALASRTKSQRIRQSQVVALHVAGLNLSEIARALNVSRRTVYRDLEQTEDARVNVESIIEDAGVDAHDAHLQLSRIMDADISEIMNDDGEVKPLKDWPLIFRQGFNVVIEDLSARSHDGEQKGDSKAWDKAGKRIKILGLDPQRLKAIELLMKHKAVDAMTQPKTGDTNILVVTAETARKVTGARKRLEKIIEIEAKSELATTIDSGFLNYGDAETSENPVNLTDSTSGT